MMKLLLLLALFVSAHCCYYDAQRNTDQFFTPDGTRTVVAQQTREQCETQNATLSALGMDTHNGRYSYFPILWGPMDLTPKFKQPLTSLTVLNSMSSGVTNDVFIVDGKYSEVVGIISTWERIAFSIEDGSEKWRMDMVAAGLVGAQQGIAATANPRLPSSPLLYYMSGKATKDECGDGCTREDFFSPARKMVIAIGIDTYDGSTKFKRAFNF